MFCLKKKNKINKYIKKKQKKNWNHSTHDCDNNDDDYNEDKDDNNNNDEFDLLKLKFCFYFLICFFDFEKN